MAILSILCWTASVAGGRKGKDKDEDGVRARAVGPFLCAI